MYTEKLTSKMVKSSVFVAAATPSELAQFFPLRYDRRDPGPSCPFQDAKMYANTGNEDKKVTSNSAQRRVDQPAVVSRV